MKKNVIIFLIIIFIFISILIFFNKTKEDKVVVMECNNEVELVQSKSIQRYTFIGKDNKVETEDLEVKLYVDEIDLINDYKRILEEQEECTNIEIIDNYITYHCHYDLLKNHQYYGDIEDENGILSFSKLKYALEEDNYICFYK